MNAKRLNQLIAGRPFLAALCLLSPGLCDAYGDQASPAFNPETDMLSLHYDHAPDKDDGHSAAADRCLLESLFGCDWIKVHVVAVSGAYGLNANTFNPQSDAVMQTAWQSCGGWMDGHHAREKTLTALTARWNETLVKGGDIWVKEGGQSDITAEVIKRLIDQTPGLKTRERIHVVQHSKWNENKTTPAALEYTRQHSHYIRISDANAYLNRKNGHEPFEQAALNHPAFGEIWKAAFEYYSPRVRLDFSDTGELMHILGLGQMDIEAFQKRFLEPVATRKTQDK